jgi:hypothetical protein
MRLRRATPCRYSTTQDGYETTVPEPVETVKNLASEAERGRSPRTPLIALTGVTLFVTAIFLVLLAIGLTLYFVYGGK